MKAKRDKKNAKKLSKSLKIKKLVKKEKLFARKPRDSKKESRLKSEK